MCKIFASQKKNRPCWKFGVRAPKNVKEARKIDKANGDHLWEEAMQKEVTQLKAYDTFKVLDQGKKAPTDHTYVPLHMFFDVKYDLRRKARLVAGGNWTDPATEDIYSGIVGIENV